ncbi:MAG: hypothetical protein NTW19_24160 [Planctomycetota bacterium]|nr:hypothetical protein [Planctomycetota bacterium]
MPVHRLKALTAPGGEWNLEWTTNEVTIHDPDRQTAFMAARRSFRFAADLRDLEDKGTVQIEMPHGPMTFRVPADAQEDLRHLAKPPPKKVVKPSTRRRVAATLFLWGAGLFLGGGLPFAGYCWLAFAVPNPVPGTLSYVLLHVVGPLIKLVLMVLLVVALLGLMLVGHAIKEFHASFLKSRRLVPDRRGEIGIDQARAYGGSVWFRFISPAARMSESQRQKLGLYEYDQSRGWHKRVALDGHEVKCVVCGVDKPPRAESLAQVDLWVANWPAHRPRIVDFIRRAAAVGQLEIRAGDTDDLRLETIEAGRAGLVEGSLLYFSDADGDGSDWSLLCDRQTPKRIVHGDLDDEMEMDDQP